MNPPKRLLLLEDDRNDVELLRLWISEELPTCEVVWLNEKEDFTIALEAGGFDLILADYLLPRCHGLWALAEARKICPDIPFIFVSGAIGDEVAVKSLKAGATDYVLKDRPARLVPAIRRALEDAAESARRKQIEERLHESAAKYRDLFENTSDLIQSVTPDGQLLYVNHAWRRALDYAESEVATLSFFDVLHPAYHEQWRERLRTAKAEDASAPWETILLTKHGQCLYLEGNIGARFEFNKVTALRGIFRDVTERKMATVALQRSVRQYEELVNSVDGIVWQADLRTLRFTFVSQHAERLLGYPIQRWLEEPNFWQDHILDEDRECALAVCKQLALEQEYQGFEYRMMAADGRIVWVRDIVSVRAENGEAPHVQGIMVDITERKLADAKVNRIQEKLKLANKDLVRRNREIQNFYHTLSHELKTPLTSAREFVSILLDGLAGGLNDTQREYLTVAKDSCDQLHVCINDLLDATRLETGKLTLDLKPTSLASVIQRAMSAFIPGATGKKITVRQEVQPDLPDVPLDESRMTQIVSNLLNNAIKFTPPGGEIVLKAGESPNNPEWIAVSVSDTGRGIPPGEQEHIFDRLYQVKSGDATTEQGIGLGLYLCSELIRLHGGSIRVESQLGNGSTFSFVVPKHRGALAGDLLLIDDDPAILEVMGELLTAESYNVRTARNGLEGLQEMRRKLPDVVLLDLAMPKLDGPATLREIRKEWGSIPVILHTAFADDERANQALAYAPLTLLAKPCPVDRILDAIRKIRHAHNPDVRKPSRPVSEKPLLKRIDTAVPRREVSYVNIH